MALFVPLDASYAQDPKILDLDDERSELLFIRSLAYCKAHLTDGMIHRRALHQLAPFADEVHADDLDGFNAATAACLAVRPCTEDCGASQ